MASTESITAFYKDGAVTYSEMMKDEVAKYEGDINELKRVAPASGRVIDTACGTGDVLPMVCAALEAQGKPVTGVVANDLSEEMLACARPKLSAGTWPVEVTTERMEELKSQEPGSFSVLINQFAIHHLADEAQLQTCVNRWSELLCPEGALYLAWWEGTGAMEMPEAHAGLVARNHSKEIVLRVLASAGLDITMQREHMEEEFEMNSAFVVCTKRSS